MRFIIFLLFIFSCGFSKAQSDSADCLVLRIANIKYLEDTVLLQPVVYKQGFYVLTNGVYDFEFNSKSFDHNRVFRITEDSIFVGYAFDSIPSNKFSINDLSAVKLWQCHDGRCGFPNYTICNRKKYQFDIRKSENFCSINPPRVCADA